MAKSKIEWCDKTWNPVTGCTPISTGCKNCYAERMSKRFGEKWGLPTDDPFKVTLYPERLGQLLRWKKASRIFVCSMADLFHNDVPTTFIAEVWNQMAWCAAEGKGHIFIILTKRPDRMAALLSDGSFRAMATFAECDLGGGPGGLPVDWPLPNVIAMTTVENQEQADRRIPFILQTPAAVRGVSVEPMLGPVDLTQVGKNRPNYIDALKGEMRSNSPISIDPSPVERFSGLDWVICGGESGHGARPMNPDWARSLRDQCVAADTPFLFKQWGEWWPINGSGNYNPGRDDTRYRGDIKFCWIDSDGKCSESGADPDSLMLKVGKKQAGRLLDGQLWDQYPAGGEPDECGFSGR